MGGLFRWNNRQGNRKPVWSGLPEDFTFPGGQDLSSYLGSYVADPGGLDMTFAKGETWPIWLDLNTAVQNNPAITVTTLDPVTVVGPFTVIATNVNGSTPSPAFTVTIVKGTNRAPIWQTATQMAPSMWHRVHR